MTKKGICGQGSWSDGNRGFKGGFFGLPYLSAHPPIRCAHICMLDDKRQSKYREGSHRPPIRTILPRYWLYWLLILALWAPHSVRKYISVVEATSLAVRTEYDTNYAIGAFFLQFGILNCIRLLWQKLGTELFQVCVYMFLCVHVEIRAWCWCLFLSSSLCYL